MKLNKTLFILGVLLIVLVFLGDAYMDRNIPFNKTGWNEDEDGEPCPPLRAKMLSDLLENHDLVGLSYTEVISKLGQPDNHERKLPSTIRFEISMNYVSGDIFHIKALDLDYNKDSIVTSWKISEYDVDM